MKRFLLFLAVIGMITAGVVSVPRLMDAQRDAEEARIRASDEFVMNQVLLLKGSKGSCTAVRIIAPSGRLYILTASHCKGLLEENQVLAVTENGIASVIFKVDESPTSDLMLLSDDRESQTGVIVAQVTFLHQHVHTMTHGAAMPSYRTDGEMLSVFHTQMLFGPGDDKNCDISMPKFEIMLGEDGIALCLLGGWYNISNAAVVPGSSGGPLLDSAGNLVGIVSGYTTGFGIFVRLEDIKEFLSAY